VKHIKLEELKNNLRSYFTKMYDYRRCYVLSKKCIFITVLFTGNFQKITEVVDIDRCR